MRPGTEMDNLRWNDILVRDDHVVITVRKGKTTLHTGNRHVVGNRIVLDMILDMHARSDESNDLKFEAPNDYNPLVFRLSDGSTTDELGRNFTVLLRRLKLNEGTGGKRTLYVWRNNRFVVRHESEFIANIKIELSLNLTHQLVNIYGRELEI